MPSPDRARLHENASLSEAYGVTEADQDAAFEALVKTMVNSYGVKDDNLRAKYDELIRDMGSRYSSERLEEAAKLAQEQKTKGNSAGTLD